MSVSTLLGVLNYFYLVFEGSILAKLSIFDDNKLAHHDHSNKRIIMIKGLNVLYYTTVTTIIWHLYDLSKDIQYKKAKIDEQEKEKMKKSHVNPKKKLKNNNTSENQNKEAKTKESKGKKTVKKNVKQNKKKTDKKKN